MVLCKLAEACASTGMIYLMHVCGTSVVVAAQNFPKRDAVLKEIAAGKHLSTLAFSEKGSRSHFANDPITSTLYYVSKSHPGLGVAGPWTGLGLRGNASAPMTLKNVAVSSVDQVSGDGEGFKVMIDVTLPWFQLGSAAVSIGICRAAVNGVQQHLSSAKLEHMGQPLSSLPNLRAQLARMQIATDTQAAFLHQVAWRLEHPKPETMLAVLESKAAANEAALQVTDMAMRACGGTAFSGRLSVERNFRDARAGSVMAPTTDVLYDFIGKAVLGLPLF
jgi:alkylation response protein AidB-like acyl-CoA dehydrogenase